MESLTGKTSEEVEIPKLAENGRNWKIYRAKIIEAAATDITDPLGVLAGWQPDDGSYDWECLDAILKWTFYTTVSISILRPIQKLDTVHKIFNYLAKHFHDSNPIVDPRATSANDAKCDVHENSHTELRESPVSDNAATEQHADAKLDEDDLTTTKALTRGTEDVDNGNVGRQDPRTKAEASVEGTSTKCAEMTTVILKGVPHEMRNEPQNSLRATPRRLPIEGEPCECKQEVANGVVTAGCTNGTAGTAKPIIADVNLEKAAPDGELAERAHRIDEGDETDVDVDRTALLGREPAEMACGVDEGDGMECRDLRLQQTYFYCEESDQRSGNTNKDVPIMHRVLLEGEWTWCANGEASDPKGDADALNAAVEHAYCPSEPRQAEGTMEIGSEGCESGTDGDAGRGIRPAEIPNESEELVTVSIQSEDLGSGGKLRVCLGNRADGSRDHADVSSGQTDAPSIETNTVIPENVPENVRSSRKELKPQYSPNVPENGMSKRSSRWRRVSADDITVYIPWNTPVEMPGRTFAFGQLERAGEAIVPSVEGETDGDGDGD